MRLLNKLIIVALSMIFYIVFTGLTSELTILTGLAVSILIAILFEPLLIKRALNLSDISKLFYLLEYLRHFLIIELKEHLMITKIVLRRRISINPKIVEVPIKLKTNYGIAFLMSTITNTPGTIALHVDTSRKILYVHWLTAKTLDPQETRKEITSKFEDVIEKIFE